MSCVVTNVCRICLITANNLNNLFEAEISKTGLTYWEMLKISVPALNIDLNDPFPNEICTDCCDQLEQTYSFHLLCFRSDKKLRDPEVEWKCEVKMETIEPDTIDRKSIINQSKGKAVFDDTRVKKEKCNRKKSEARSRNRSHKSTSNRQKRRKHEECYKNGKYIRNKRIPKYECDICGRRMTGKYNLQEHFRTHTGERPFTCEICGKTFVTRGHWQNHFQTHQDTPTKRYGCEQCKFKTNMKYRLLLHSMVHTGEISFPCHICSKKFSGKSNLNAHIKIMHSEPSFSCELCPEKFRRIGSLKKHIFCHYSPAQYRCPNCGKAYSNYGGLFYHMKHTYVNVKIPSEKQARIVNTTMT